MSVATNHDRRACSCVAEGLKVLDFRLPFFFYAGNMETCPINGSVGKVSATFSVLSGVTT